MRFYRTLRPTGKNAVPVPYHTARRDVTRKSTDKRKKLQERGGGLNAGGDDIRVEWIK